MEHSHGESGCAATSRVAGGLEHLAKSTEVAHQDFLAADFDDAVSLHDVKGPAYNLPHAADQRRKVVKGDSPRDEDPFGCLSAVLAGGEIDVAGDPLLHRLQADLLHQLRERPEIVRVHLASGPVLAAAEAFSKWVRAMPSLAASAFIMVTKPASEPPMCSARALEASFPL